MKVLLLILLGATPIALNFAFRPDIFPPINPASSGATGASLLASSLGVVAIFLLMPFSIQIPIREKFFFWPYFALLMLHLYFWLSISHGHTSNHEMPQILGLASMLVWVPLLFFYYRKFDWGNYLWVYSFAFWGSLLVPTAVITFLPYNLEAAKFTSLLVAHVHIAMAGMTTSFAALILSNLLRSKKMTDIFCSKKDYFLWQVGLILHLLALALLGIREVNQRHFLFSGEFASFFPLTLRVVAGALMTYSSLRWLCSRIDYE